MFALLKNKNPYEQAAGLIYTILLERTREPALYLDYSVPDTMDGRFDLLLLHIFLFIDRLSGEDDCDGEFAQAIFDITFADMDQTLREMGIGDMGVPKHMRRMMKAFNGRMHAYDSALSRGGGKAMEMALKRNVYGIFSGVRSSYVVAMKRYVDRNTALLKTQSLADFLEGRVVLAEVGNGL